MRLQRAFYLRPTLEVARDLLGKYLVFQNKSGKIVEVEAYIGHDDLACHASSGKTKRNEVMFFRGGHAYIYIIYGLYHCLNIVTEKEDFPAAVLIRAIELEGANGPGKLCRAFGLTRDHNGLDLTTTLKVNPERSRGVDLTKPPLYIEDREEQITQSQIAQTPRIGVDYAGKSAQLPWRFIIKNSPYLSKRTKHG